MMKPTIDVERVVREVLAELGIAPASSDGDRRHETSNKEKQQKAEGGRPRAETNRQCGTDSADLVLSARVVTMAEVAGRLKAVRRLVVRQEAVVTPAVRDELLSRGIALARADSAREPSAANVRLALIAVGSEFRSGRLIAALANEYSDVEPSTSDCLIAATDQLAGELAKPNTLGVLLTADVAAGLCLANRRQGIRAVAGAADANAVGANLLIVDPKAITFFQLKQMIVEFCRGGVRPCPAVFRTRLA
jgi:hypothetical protein